MADTLTSRTHALRNPATGAAMAHAHATCHTARRRVSTFVENTPNHGATIAHATSTPTVVTTSRHVSSSVECVGEPDDGEHDQDNDVANDGPPKQGTIREFEHARR